MSKTRQRANADGSRDRREIADTISLPQASGRVPAEGRSTMAAVATIRTNGRKPAHDEFTSSDVEDLIWLWNEAESEYGIRSTQGGIEDQLNRNAIGDEALADLALARRRLNRHLKAKTETRLSLDELDANMQRAIAEALRDPEYMHISGTSHAGSSAPFENDRAMGGVRRARRIRTRLNAIHEHHRLVLHAVHGPFRINVDDREVLRKKFGELVQIVVNIVAAAREEGDPSAVTLTLTKSRDDSFVTMQNRRAIALHEHAKNAYGKAKLLAWT